MESCVWHGVARHLLDDQHSLRSARGSIPHLDILSNDKLVLVLDELGQRGHLRAPTVDWYVGVLGSLESNMASCGQASRK